MANFGTSSATAPRKRPRFVFLLWLAHRRVQGVIQGDADGRTGTRAGVLMALSADGDAIPMKRLGTAVGLGAPALSGLIDRMVLDDLVERRADAADRRAWNIALTNKGKQQRSAAVSAARRMNDRLCEGFDDAELAIVARWLESVATEFSKETAK